MERKEKQKRPAQFPRVAVDDIMNMNEGASKKRKKSLLPPPHLRPAVLKTLKLKPDPTLLFSQFKPKENQVKTITNSSDTSPVTEKYGSHSVKESSKVGFSKLWTPPIKSAASHKKPAIPSSSFQQIGVSKECNKMKKVEFNSISEKPNLDFKTNKIGDVNANTHISYGLEGNNDADIDRYAFNGGSQSGREVIYLGKNQDKAGQDDPYRNPTGIDTLLEAIDVIEANIEYNIKMENSIANHSKHEADEIDGVGEQQFFNEDRDQENSLTETNPSDLSIFDPTPNGQGHGGAILYQKEESFEFDTQPFEPLTDMNYTRSDLPAELIDLTNESVEEDSRSLEKTFDSEEPVEVKTATDGSGNVNIDEYNYQCSDYDNNLSKTSSDESGNLIIDEDHDNSLTSDSEEYTETVIVKFTSPVICTVINKARNSTEVLKDLGSENVNSDSDQGDSVEETPLDKRNEGEKDMIDSNDEGEGDKSDIEESTDAEDEKIMKEIRTYVYDSLKSSHKQEENSNLIEYGNETDDVSQNHLIKSQIYENNVVTNADQAVSYDYGYVEEKDIDCKVNENKEENEVKPIYERTSVDGEDGPDSYQQNTNNDNDETDSYQEITNKDNDDDDEDARDERIEEWKEPVMDEEQRALKEPTPEHMNSENSASKVFDDQQIDEMEEALKSSEENVQDELLNEDDDAFDMSCTQLIHIENEYSNKTNGNVGDETAALRNKPINLNAGNVQIPSVSENNNARPIPDLSLQWVDRRAEEKQKLRAVIQELSQLNARITQFRQLLWPKMNRN
ncbi:hypothetical protein LSTR_LSTR006843 [Laodelphax striatellus]|uniref:Uncharacterized protein n=1 Tax=Laodelphax striatellus TaxID=195883 RepID=A0A482XEV2_LAOST|nr:hypothetical protein LSTR_LSTR006843 [Laodelphax striatellus]